MPKCNFLDAEKAARLLRLGFGGGDVLRPRRQRENLRMVETNLSRNATALPVLDTLDAVAQARRELRRASQVLDEVFIRRHFFHP
jgi:hypothetical protein